MFIVSELFDKLPIDLNSLFQDATDDIVEINIMYASNCVSVDVEHENGNFFEAHIDVDSFEEAKQKKIIRAHGVSCHSLGALKAAAESAWVDYIQPSL